MIAPEEPYHAAPIECIITIYDLRFVAEEQIHRERVAWRGYADIEPLDRHYLALIVRPGGALRHAT